MPSKFASSSELAADEGQDFEKGAPYPTSRHLPINYPQVDEIVPSLLIDRGL